MGLIKAALGTLGGTLANQWKDYFYCEAMPPEVLAVKGKKRESGRSSNTKGDANIISDGSVIAVATGQCMILVVQGKVTEVCAEPGEFTYEASSAPSLFTGDLKESMQNTLVDMMKRFSFGGEAALDQRTELETATHFLDNRIALEGFNHGREGSG